MEKKFLTTKEAAAYMGISADRLHKWRANESPEGPPFLKEGKIVRYAVKDIEEWVERRMTYPKEDFAS